MSKTLLFFLVVSLVAFNQSTFAQPSSRGMMALNSSTKKTERRIALVIGNKNYEHPGAALQNPINDADDMAITLDGLGFDVIKRTDLTLSSFNYILDEFGEKLPNYDVALFYFSGHGVNFNGENYLVPIDAHLQTLLDSEGDCIRLSRIMDKMKSAEVKNSLVFLDACRNNPFPKSNGVRGTTRSGLIIPNNPAGSAVVFATEEGSTADDNTKERNGLFTSELLLHLPVPNLSLSDIILKTRQGVYERSGKNQLPSDYNKMLGGFYFVKESENSLPKLNPNEGKYTGEFKDGLRSGQGTLVLDNGDRYIGEFNNGFKNGRGTLLYANGDRYTGEFKDGLRNGQGTLALDNGDEYLGGFKDDMKNGQGTLMYINGDKYTGEYKDGKMYGQGILTLANGAEYIGNFEEDTFNGQGTYTYQNGDKYVGEFKNGKLNGRGTYTYRDGEKYVGEYKDGLKNGQGIYTLSNGDKYIGYFINGKYVGKTNTP